MEKAKEEEFREEERVMINGWGEEEKVDGNHDLIRIGRRGGWEL